MDSLVEEIGKPPYWITALTGVHQHGLDLLQEIQSGAAVDLPKTTQTIDKLEALASICFHAYDNELIMHGTGSDASLASLTTTIWELKRAVFSQQMRPVSEASNVCLFCGWALERIGNEITGKYSWSSWQAPQWMANCYLCAIDSWPDFPGLEASAQDGCDLCRFLKDLIEKKGVQLSPSRPGSDFSQVGVWIDFRYVPRKAGGDVVRPELMNALEYGSVFLSTTSPWYSTPVSQFMVESRDEQVAAELQVRSPPHKEPWSSSNIDFTRSILNATPAKTTAFTPTRLLFLDLSPNSPVKLITTPSSGVNYASLSYCWGPPSDAAKQTTLTTSNLASRSAGIPLSELSPVMRDTVTVCRSLGISYLWIDALCIIQDSKTDWELESQQMARIYENAHLTVCAVGSSSCLEGFLGRRDVYPEYLYTSPANSLVKGGFTFRPVPSDRGVTATALSPPLEQDLTVASWNERGWVFQEKAMSTNKLFFGKTMVHVQTNSIIYSENGHHQHIKVNTYDDRNTSPNTLPLALLLQTKSHNPHDLWLSTITKFAGLKWTVEEDLFPGLSGPASRFHDILPNDNSYLAGHWQSDLPASLPWATGRRDLLPRPSKTLSSLLQTLRKGNTLHAPTWSWAGRKAVDFFRFVHSTPDLRKCRVRSHLRPEFTLVRSNVRVEGANPFGRLTPTTPTPNSLTLSGRAIPLSSILPPENPSWKFYTEGADWECANPLKGYLLLVSHDWDAGPGRNHNLNDEGAPPAGSTEDQLSKLKLLLVSSCCSEYSSDLPPGSVKPRTEMTTKILFPAEYNKTFLTDPDFQPGDGSCPFCQDRKRKRDVWGLLLYPADDAPGKRYYRVGLFYSRAQHGGSELFDEAKVCEVELV
ncbi:heterokaryon incompatibility protein-domain-containing protein [Cercophora samala]|uniref:Heterokaryon incompatibility protein-domain-containing protein n=1 Tax=Cercophora samala TaxID=330535 RepID=A0AA39ZB30_9PEZI|nr:heterokaryon incompatibility protein-domain-containing protein [Cercophora samala]